MKMASLPNNFVFSSESMSELAHNSTDIALMTPHIFSSLTTETLKPILKIDKNESQTKKSVVDSNDNINNEIQSTIISSIESYRTSPKITIEANYENPINNEDIRSPELLAPKTGCRKFSDFMD